MRLLDASVRIGQTFTRAPERLRDNEADVSSGTRTRRVASPWHPIQSACFRKNAGISISSIPLLASASTFAAAVRPLRHTLGVLSAL